MYFYWCYEIIWKFIFGGPETSIYQGTVRRRKLEDRSNLKLKLRYSESLCSVSHFFKGIEIPDAWASRLKMLKYQMPLFLIFALTDLDSGLRLPQGTSSQRVLRTMWEDTPRNTAHMRQHGKFEYLNSKNRWILKFSALFHRNLDFRKIDISQLFS